MSEIKESDIDKYEMIRFDKLQPIIKFLLKEKGIVDGLILISSKENGEVLKVERMNKLPSEWLREGLKNVSGNGTGEMSTRSERAVHQSRQKKPKMTGKDLFNSGIIRLLEEREDKSKKPKDRE
jgi:hypothetical protein